VLACQMNKIEVWDAEAHRKLMDDEPKSFGALAKKVMGNKSKEQE
jgi:MraZ protein